MNIGIQKITARPCATGYARTEQHMKPPRQEAESVQDEILFIVVPSLNICTNYMQQKTNLYQPYQIMAGLAKLGSATQSVHWPGKGNKELHS
jgi:hypothetical protein